MYYYIVCKDKYFCGYKPVVPNQDENDERFKLWFEKKMCLDVMKFRTKEQAMQEAETAGLKKYVIKSI